jgi:hypothetical protein
MRQKHLFITAAFLLILFRPGWNKAFCQSVFIPLNDDSYHYLERLEIKSGRVSDQLHFSALPLQRSDAVLFLDSLGVSDSALQDDKSVDYLLTDNDEWSAYPGAISKKPILKYFYRDKASLYQYRSDDFMVKVNPVFHFGYGLESASDPSQFYQYARH